MTKNKKNESNLAVGCIQEEEGRICKGARERISDECWFGVFELRSTCTTVRLYVLYAVRPGLFVPSGTGVNNSVNDGAAVAAALLLMLLRFRLLYHTVFLIYVAAIAAAIVVVVVYTFVPLRIRKIIL
jgi:hypothetical protein